MIRLLSMLLFVIPAEAGIQKYEKENPPWIDLYESICR